MFEIVGIIFAIFFGLVVYCVVGFFVTLLITKTYDELGIGSEWICEAAEVGICPFVAFWPIMFVSWIAVCIFSIPFILARLFVSKLLGLSV